MATGRKPGPLVASHFAYLRQMETGRHWYPLGNSMLLSLKRRGLVEQCEVTASGFWWEITDAGRQALAALSAATGSGE